MTKIIKMKQKTKQPELTDKEIQEYLQNTDLIIDVLLLLEETDSLNQENLDRLEMDPINTVRQLLYYIYILENEYHED